GWQIAYKYQSVTEPPRSARNVANAVKLSLRPMQPIRNITDTCREFSETSDGKRGDHTMITGTWAKSIAGAMALAVLSGPAAAGSLKDEPVPSDRIFAWSASFAVTNDYVFR